MIFECDCTMTGSVLGDGCIKCNTRHFFDLIPQPNEMKDELMQDGFTEDQAYYISHDIYSPLISVIQVLNEKVDELAKRVE